MLPLESPSSGLVLLQRPAGELQISPPGWQGSLHTSPKPLWLPLLAIVRMGIGDSLRGATEARFRRPR